MNKMKKYILILFICSFFTFNINGYAQALPINSQYMFNQYLINAAYGGTYLFTPIVINHRNQWVGFGDSAPQTSSISMHSSFGERSGVGVYMISDETFPISRTQTQLSYSYHSVLKNKLVLSMALSGTWNVDQFSYQEGITYSEMQNGITDIVNTENETESVADINFGIMLFNDNFDIGLSIRNLMAPEPIDVNIEDPIKRVRYILLHGSYMASNPNSAIGIIPSFVMRKMSVATYNSVYEFDFNFKLVYRNNIWTGFSYRTHEKSFATLVGFNTQKMFIGWSYEIGNSGLASYHHGSHNIALGLKIIGKNARAVRNQTPLYLNIDSEWKKMGFFNTRQHKSGK